MHNDLKHGNLPKIIEVGANVDHVAIVSLLKECVGVNERERAVMIWQNYVRPYPGLRLFGLMDCESRYGVFGIIGIIDMDAQVTIAHLAIAAPFRRRSWGTVLVNHVVELAHGRMILAETDDDAVAFYRRCGFKCFTIESPYPRPRYRCLCKVGLSGEELPFLPQHPS